MYVFLDQAMTDLLYSIIFGNVHCTCRLQTSAAAVLMYVHVHIHVHVHVLSALSTRIYIPPNISHLLCAVDTMVNNRHCSGVEKLTSIFPISNLKSMYVSYKWRIHSRSCTHTKKRVDVTRIVLKYTLSNARNIIRLTFTKKLVDVRTRTDVWAVRRLWSIASRHLADHRRD